MCVSLLTREWRSKGSQGASSHVKWPLWFHVPVFWRGARSSTWFYLAAEKKSSCRISFTSHSQEANQEWKPPDKRYFVPLSIEDLCAGLQTWAMSCSWKQCPKGSANPEMASQDQLSVGNCREYMNGLLRFDGINFPGTWAFNINNPLKHNSSCWRVKQTRVLWFLSCSWKATLVNNHWEQKYQSLLWSSDPSQKTGGFCGQKNSFALTFISKDRWQTSWHGHSINRYELDHVLLQVATVLCE